VKFESHMYVGHFGALGKTDALPNRKWKMALMEYKAYLRTYLKIYRKTHIVLLQGYEVKFTNYTLQSLGNI
jgi:hypothetical protein